MSPWKLVLAFVPLVAFSVVVSLGGVGAVPAAALFSLALAGALVGYALVRRETPKLIGVVTTAVFAVFLVVALAVPGGAEFLAGYGRALAPVAVAVAIFALLPRLPFTEQYARDVVPRQYWDTPRFHALNRKLSALWGGVIAALGICHALAEVLFGGHGLPAALVGWGVPLVLLVVAVRATTRASSTDHPGAHERPATR